MDTGLLVARLVFGSVMAAHGAQKLFGWFGGYGIAGTGGFFESVGFRPGRALALAAGTGERIGALGQLQWSDIDIAGRWVTFRKETRKGRGSQRDNVQRDNDQWEDVQ